MIKFTSNYRYVIAALLSIVVITIAWQILDYPQSTSGLRVKGIVTHISKHPSRSTNRIQIIVRLENGLTIPFEEYNDRQLSLNMQVYVLVNERRFSKIKTYALL